MRLGGTVLVDFQNVIKFGMTFLAPQTKRICLDIAYSTSPRRIVRDGLNHINGNPPAAMGCYAHSPPDAGRPPVINLVTNGIVRHPLTPRVLL